MPTTPQHTAIPFGFSELELDEHSQRGLLELDAWAFPAPQDITELSSWPLPFEMERTRAWRADDDPSPVAMHSSYAFAEFPVPGGTLPAAGLSWVGVHPQYRRRGMLRAMIATHFEDCERRGESISALTASEPAIYGRFGYGLASRAVSVRIPHGAALREVPQANAVPIRFERFDATTHGALVAHLHRRAARITPNRPGWVTRETAALRAAFEHDPASLRDGFEERRILIAGGQEPTGYALFRRKLDWGAAGAEGTAKVEELVGLDPASTAALWSHLLDLDLIGTVTARMLALDDPLMHLLLDARRAEPRVTDNLWVRIVDLVTALATRQYAAPLDLRIGVSDQLRVANNGCWRLQAEAFSDDVRIVPADDAQVTLGVRELGALYLGGASAASLAAAGLIQGDAASVAQLSAAFSWPNQPSSSWIF